MRVPTVCVHPYEIPTSDRMRPCGSKTFTRDVQGTYNDVERIGLDNLFPDVISSHDEPDTFGDWTCENDHAQTQDATWREL